MQHAVACRVFDGEAWREVHGVSENVSERGVLFVGEEAVPKGSRVEITLSLQPETGPAVRLFCPGTVVRVEEGRGNHRIALAVECERLLEQLVGNAADA